MFNLYADVDARSMTPSRNPRSYTLRSVPSSPGRSFFSSFQVTPLSKRVYSESNDQEMDIWLQVTNLKVKYDVVTSPLLCSSWPSLPPTGRGTRPSHSR